MSDLQWQPLYGKCEQCKGPARFRVDTRVHPHIGGKIGIRCEACAAPHVHSFTATTDGELSSQAKAKREYEAHEAKAPEREREWDAWQLLHCGNLGLMPQPPGTKEGIHEVWQPDERTLNYWRYLRLQAQEDHGDRPADD